MGGRIVDNAHKRLLWRKDDGWIPCKFVSIPSSPGTVRRIIRSLNGRAHIPVLQSTPAIEIRLGLPNRFVKMHSSSSISLKVFTDACATTRILSHDCVNWRRESPSMTRNYKIVCCSSSSSSEKGSSLKYGGNAGAFLSKGQTYALLKQKMEVAAKSEDYEEAARIRDSLKLFEEEEPVLQLRRLMKEAVAEERFEDAAKYRNELKEIAPHSLLKCSSDATTLGIRVQVRSVYIEGRSQPSRGQYFFAYRIRITNNSDRPVQLLRRHWIITDANNKTESLWGIGVIGEQPVILPKTSFEYSSACPLCTASGRMEGDFEMKHVDRVKLPTFNVAIAPFSLSTLGDDSNSF